MFGVRRYFYVDQANALIPAMRDVFTHTRKLRARLERLVKHLEQQGHRPDPQQLAVDPAAPPHVQEQQREVLELVSELDRHLERVKEMGPEVRRADGLVDFYSRRGGRVVCLCWRWGEDRVTHYHDPEDGLAGRRPIRRPHEFEGDLLN